MERLFRLSTNIEIVQQTLKMKPIGAATFVAADSRVHWRGWKFGWVTHHHTLITAFEEPHVQDGWHMASFQDAQERGRFASFCHNHVFRQREGDTFTTLEDRVDFSLPFWMGGSLAERSLLAPYIRRLLQERFALLKELAEGEGWRLYLRQQSR